MTALAEGERELNNDNLSDNDNENENENENDNNSSYEYKKTGGEEKEDDAELVDFLEKHDLMDMREEILCSKLKLSHFEEVEKSDLEDLCSDLKLNSSQKIRLKHAIKSLQRKIVRNRIKNKMKSQVLKSKNKMKDLKKKRLIQRKSNKDNSNISNIANINVDDDKIRKLRSKIVIVGEAAVGKTTLQKAMMGYEFEDGSKPTFAVSSSHHKSQYQYKDLNMMVDYEIFDTPGLDRFCDIITLYLRGALAVIVVYDVCNIKSFQKGKWWINYLENNASGYDKIILIANKIDIKHQIQNYEHDEESEDDSDDDDDDEYDDNTTAGGDVDEYDIIKEGRLYATEHGIAFLEISAKNKENVNVLLSWINKQSQKKIEQNPRLIEKKDSSIQLHAALINGKPMKSGKFFDKFDNLDFDYSKCCAF